jgi:hypothetical protein
MVVSSHGAGRIWWRSSTQTCNSGLSPGSVHDETLYTIDAPQANVPNHPGVSKRWRSRRATTTAFPLSTMRGGAEFVRNPDLIQEGSALGSCTGVLCVPHDPPARLSRLEHVVILAMIVEGR